MSNSHIKRIQVLKAQRTVLAKMISERTYLAAGLSIDVTVGPKKPDDEMPLLQLELGLNTDLELIAKTILDGIDRTIAWHLVDLRKEHEDVRKFLAESTVYGATS